MSTPMWPPAKNKDERNIEEKMMALAASLAELDILLRNAGQIGARIGNWVWDPKHSLKDMF